MKRSLHIVKMASVAIAAGAAALAFSPAHAVNVQVTITNTSTDTNLSLTPLYFAFHNGSVDLFDVGSVASNGIEQIAETGNFMPVRDERVAIQGDSQGGGLTAPGSPFTSATLPPIVEPGETATVIIDVDPSNRFFSFLSMLLPSNDTFIGNDDAQAYEIFDINGDLIAQTIDVTGLNLYDAGTEQNDFANGPAFVPGQDIAAGGAGEGSVQLATDLGLLTAIAAANGLTIDPALIDFVSNRSGFSLASISISAAPVPLPAAAIPMITGLFAMGAAARRKKKVAVV